MQHLSQPSDGELMAIRRKVLDEVAERGLCGAKYLIKITRADGVSEERIANGRRDAMRDFNALMMVEAHRLGCNPYRMAWADRVELAVSCVRDQFGSVLEITALG